MSHNRGGDVTEFPAKRCDGVVERNGLIFKLSLPNLPQEMWETLRALELAKHLPLLTIFPQRENT